MMIFCFSDRFCPCWLLVFDNGCPWWFVGFCNTMPMMICWCLLTDDAHNDLLLIFDKLCLWCWVVFGCQMAPTMLSCLLSVHGHNDWAFFSYHADDHLFVGIWCPCFLVLMMLVLCDEIMPMMYKFAHVVHMVHTLSDHAHNDLLCSDNAHAALWVYQFSPMMRLLLHRMPMVICFDLEDTHDALMCYRMMSIMTRFIMPRPWWFDFCIVPWPCCFCVCQLVPMMLTCLSYDIDDDVCLSVDAHYAEYLSHNAHYALL